MAGAHADPEDLKRFAKQLRDTRQQVDQLGKGLKRTMASLDWNDAVKRKVDGDVSAVVKGLERFGSQLDEHAREVERKASELRTYLGR